MSVEWEIKGNQNEEGGNRELKIAIGSSAGAYGWENTAVTWEKLCERLKAPKRTAETDAQYHAMSRDEKAKEKDISPDCYNAVIRYYAARWGIDQFVPAGLPEGCLQGTDNQNDALFSPQ